MHFQIGDGAAKLVRCARRDRRCHGGHPPWLTDLRRVGGVPLDEDNMRSVYCAVGFAHGFCVLSHVADVMYKQSNYYADATERGIAYNDPDVAIEWPLPVEELIPSKRDTAAPLLRDIETELPFICSGASADSLLLTLSGGAS
jgi:dTDP-4-dehydrorhamnose 3,5-epimerase